MKPRSERGMTKASQATAAEAVLGRIRAERGLGGVLALHREFVDLTGDVKAALLLSQLLYWTDRTTNPEGWIYKTHADWQQELGLTRHEVDRARRVLCICGVLQQKIRMAGNGFRTLYYRLDLPTLRACLEDLYGLRHAVAEPERPGTPPPPPPNPSYPLPCVPSGGMATVRVSRGEAAGCARCAGVLR